MTYLTNPLFKDLNDTDKIIDIIVKGFPRNKFVDIYIEPNIRSGLVMLKAIEKLNSHLIKGFSDNECVKAVYESIGKDSEDELANELEELYKEWQNKIKKSVFLDHQLYRTTKKLDRDIVLSKRAPAYMLLDLWDLRGVITEGYLRDKLDSFPDTYPTMEELRRNEVSCEMSDKKNMFDFLEEQLESKTILSRFMFLDVTRNETFKLTGEEQIKLSELLNKFTEKGIDWMLVADTRMWVRSLYPNEFYINIIEEGKIIIKNY